LNFVHGFVEILTAGCWVFPNRKTSIKSDLNPAFVDSEKEKANFSMSGRLLNNLFAGFILKKNKGGEE
jgi:hypothetical protein